MAWYLNHQEQGRLPASAGKTYSSFKISLARHPAYQGQYLFSPWSFLADQSGSDEQGRGGVGSWAFTNLKIPYEISVAAKRVRRVLLSPSPWNLFADEPTGALDPKSSAALLDVFEDMSLPWAKPFSWWPTNRSQRVPRQVFHRGVDSYKSRSSVKKTERQMLPRNSDTLACHGGEGGSWCLNYQVN